MKIDKQTQQEISKHVDQAMKKINWGKEALAEVEKLRRDFDKRISEIERDIKYMEAVTTKVDVSISQDARKMKDKVSKLEKRLATLEKRK